MIPEFPEFKKLELTDKEDVERVTNTYRPYSDFNFTSMWSWDTESDMLVSKLNGNIVIRFSDYLTLKPFYSFIGGNDVCDTVSKIIELSQKEGLEAKIKFAPEECIQNIDVQKYLVEEDRDHFDYILDNDRLAEFTGSDLRGHASFKRRLMDLHTTDLTTRVLDIHDPAVQKQIISLNELWISNKVSQNKDIFPDIEDRAMKKFFAMPKNEKLYVLVGIFHKETMIAFTIDELLGGNYSLRHFMKADAAFKGIYSHLVSESAKVLLTHGKKHTNIEQDLGLANLRQSKKSYQPAHFLKKYIVTLHG